MDGAARVRAESSDVWASWANDLTTVLWEELTFGDDDWDLWASDVFSTLCPELLDEVNDWEIWAGNVFGHLLDSVLVPGDNGGEFDIISEQTWGLLGLGSLSRNIWVRTMIDYDFDQEIADRHITVTYARAYELSDLLGRSPIEFAGQTTEWAEQQAREVWFLMKVCFVRRHRSLCTESETLSSC